MRPGRRTTTRGNTAAARCGKRRRSIPSSASSISRRATPVPTTTAPCAPVIICTRCRSLRSSSRPASTGGTSSRFITTSGITIRAIPSCSWISTSRAARAKRSSRSARRAGRTSSIARPASRSSASTSGPFRKSRCKRRPPRSRSRAATRSCRRRSRSRRRDRTSSTKGESSRRSRVRTRRSSSPAFGAAPAGRRARTTPSNSTCSFVPPRTPAVTPVEIDPNFKPPVQGGRFGMGQTQGTRLPRTGVIAAMDMTTNTIVWRYRWPEQCIQRHAGDGRRSVVRRSQRRPTHRSRFAHGKQLWEFQTGAGMHAPTSTFVHRGKQYVLAYSSGSALIGSPRGDSVWLFGLEGTLPPAEPGVPVNRLAAAIPTAPAAPAAPTAAARRRRRVASHGGQSERQARVPGDLRDLPRRGWARRPRRRGAPEHRSERGSGRSTS